MESTLPEQLFRGVYEEYWELLYRIACKKTGSHNDALDIVQETFTYVWQQVAVLQQVETARIRSYLVTCLYYRIMGYFRANGLKDKHLHFFQLQLAQEPATYSPRMVLEEELEMEAISVAIMGELDKMPERMKEIFLLNHFDNKSVTEIAQVYNMSDKTVRNQLSMAKKRLRDFADGYPARELAPLILLFLLKD